MTLPHSLVFLKKLTEKFEENEIVFEENSPENLSLKHVVHSEIPIADNPEFLKNPAVILQFQLLLLTGLSMFGGVFIPVIRSLVEEENGIKITWDSGLSDSITWGVWDSKTQVACNYILDRLSGKRVYKEGINGEATVYLIKSLIESYATILNACNEQVLSILNKKRSLFSHIAASPSHDLIFIIISSLPTDQMNALYLYIQQFFPENLDVISPSGNKINVSVLFQTPGIKVEYLMEKTRVYLDLYFSRKYPILKEITQTKTLMFLEKTLQNTQCLEQTVTTLQNLKTIQIDTRLSLYRLMSAHLSSLMVA